MAVNEAVGVVARERDDLKNDLNLIAVKIQLEEKAIKEQYALQLRDRDGEIARLRDMKARLSTKMVGETLEQHCEIEFNRIRAAAFQRAHFEKDNDARTGSKGDYIFRDSDESGAEIVSIMFEMKNESDETATKKRNEDFLKELDKDRTEKACEYAVLVSLLERVVQQRHRRCVSPLPQDVRGAAAVLCAPDHAVAQCRFECDEVQVRAGLGALAERGHHQV